MSIAISRSVGIPGGQGRVGSLAFAPVAAVGWVVVALLGFAVRVALFREHRTQGIVSVLWGLGFALFLWSGLRALGLHDGRAIPFAIVAWTAIALFIYLRGAALENPPVEQPGVFHRRLLALWRASRTSSFPTGPHAMKRRELAQAEAALDKGEFKTALYLLQEAERVAVAQRRLDDLLAARELVRSLSARSRGHTKAAGERLARKVTEHLNAFPSDALVSVGIRKEPERDLAGLPLIRQRLRERAGGDAIPTSRELSRARAALDDSEFAAALYLLQEARRVAVAQQKLDELLAVDSCSRPSSSGAPAGLVLRADGLPVRLRQVCATRPACSAGRSFRARRDWSAPRKRFPNDRTQAQTCVEKGRLRRRRHRERSEMNQLSEDSR